MVKRHGFSLLELLVALAIVALLASAAVPLWNRHTERARRLDATAALMRVAVLQERFYLNNGRYAVSGELATPAPDGLGVTGTERGHYRVSLQGLEGDPAAGYEAQATADLQGPQAGDERCRVFSLDSTGRRAAETSDGADSSMECWP